MHTQIMDRLIYQFIIKTIKDVYKQMDKIDKCKYYFKLTYNRVSINKITNILLTVIVNRFTKNSEFVVLLYS